MEWRWMYHVVLMDQSVTCPRPISNKTSICDPDWIKPEHLDQFHKRIDPFNIPYRIRLDHHLEAHIKKPHNSDPFENWYWIKLEPPSDPSLKGVHRCTVQIHLSLIQENCLTISKLFGACLSIGIRYRTKVPAKWKSIGSICILDILKKSPKIGQNREKPDFLWRPTSWDAEGRTRK